jgi:hypothetical protein
MLSIGVWLSLVERTVRVREVGSSNLPTPIFGPRQVDPLDITSLKPGGSLRVSPTEGRCSVPPPAVLHASLHPTRVRDRHL